MILCTTEPCKGLAMKVMIFHPTSRGDLSRIKSFGGVWAHYLERELSNLGVEVVPVPWMRLRGLSDQDLIEYHHELDINGIDHILGLGIRYWSFLPAECGQVLRARLGRHQCLAQVHDVSLLNKTPADVTFVHSSKPPKGSEDDDHQRYKRHTCLVGWAADSDLCRPNQPDDELHILVDHSTFNHTSTDVTLSALLNLRELVLKPELWRDRFNAIRIRQLVDGAIVDVDVTGDLTVKPYNRIGVPYLDACAEYSKAHIFMVTHAESVGQTVIETATAGAFVITYKDFIPHDRLGTVRHHEWSHFIRWNKVLRAIDVEASRRKAMKNSWTDIATTMVDYFESFDREKMGWPLEGGGLQSWPGNGEGFP